MKIVWDNTDEYLYGTTPKIKKLIKRSTKIASFDLDQTLITCKSNKKFPIDEDDWKFMYEQVPDILKNYVKEGYLFVIVSNQAGLKNEKQKNQWMTKLENIIEELDLECMVLCSTGKNKYRKPSISFREEFFPKELDDTSFYCGDACGREDDHADTDLKFALNMKVKFITPEHCFLDKKNKYPKKIDYPVNVNKCESKESDYKFKPSKKREMIIMVGYPASGKSYVSKELEKKYKYVIINQDDLKTKAKCIKMAKEKLEEKKSIIIDATNPSKKSREEWIEIGNKYKCEIKFIVMESSLELSKHNNYYRNATSDRGVIPDIAYNLYKSKYEEPDSEEECDEIIECICGSPNDERYYRYFF